MADLAQALGNGAPCSSTSMGSDPRRNKLMSVSSALNVGLAATAAVPLWQATGL
ncbi:hypothetical protein ACIF80_12400 [Streptomyces sp. NPDC085927]|uniref:hypothetical protein n=1 Tax=Streptomyces sp. NPDC085927 TaxID=3365738 RepID=UPI0037D2632E